MRALSTLLDALRIPNDDAISKLTEHRAQLETLTRALLASETLDEADAYAAAGVARHAADQDGGGPASAGGQAAARSQRDAPMRTD